MHDLEAKSIEQVVQAITDAGIQQLYLVIRTQDIAYLVMELLEGGTYMHNSSQSRINIQ